MSFNDQNDALHDCIYGGPAPQELILERLSAADLSFPVMTSVQTEESFTEDWTGWNFRPGDGLVYRTVSPRSGLDDRWRIAHNPLEWQWTLQLCIMDMRRRHWAVADIDLRPETEARLRQLALQHCRTARPEWRDAVACWSDVVLRRTAKKIHDTHRAFLGFLIEASEPLVTIGIVGHRFHHAMQQLLVGFTSTAMVHWLMQGIEIVLEQQSRQNRQLDSTILRALAYIQDHLTEPLSMEDVAQSIGITPAAFSRKFKAAMGQTYTAHLQTMRLERAIPLLLRTNRTILDIALDCGFGSVEQFHRIFKQRQGVTPLAYRRGKPKVV